MDIVVSGRNVEVPEHYRQHVVGKLSKIERFDHKVIRIDVELHHEPNRRQSSACQHVEITCKSRGPVVRSEACAADFYAALDTAAGRLESRLRRAADRRRIHYGQRRPRSVLDAMDATVTPEESAEVAETAEVAGSASRGPAVQPPPEPVTSARLSHRDDTAPGPGAVDDTLGRVVRHKEHDGAPMSVDQALHEMELVGHDFYLFADAESGLPSVVYRRKGYAYGVIRLTSQSGVRQPPRPRAPAVDAIPAQQPRAYATQG